MGGSFAVPSFCKNCKSKKKQNEENPPKEAKTYRVYCNTFPDIDSPTWVTIKNRRKPKPKTNCIKTTRYNVLTFLPKNLFEQFHRVANVYFAILIGLNWIPVINAISKEVNNIRFIFCNYLIIFLNILFRLHLYH